MVGASPKKRAASAKPASRPAAAKAQPATHKPAVAKGASPASAAGAAPRTLAGKVWDAHVVRRAEGEPDLLYIDLHLVHEVTSPQAFDGLRLAGRPLRRPDLTLATEDHNTPTDNLLTIADPISRTQVE